MIDQMVRNELCKRCPLLPGLKKEPIKLNYKKMDENNGIAPYFLDASQRS